ncbi:MAG TPA: hypothetical protein VFO85_04760, partial [Vicinamibacteria bacterium]|nr:hypothetical protein [Vicinamibacteria bacterium]
ARLRRDVGAGSTLGTLLTWRRFPGRENVLASADGRFQLGPATVLNVQGAGSWTRTATTGSGWSPGRAGAGYRVSASRQGRHFTVGVNADGRSPLYAADLGYTAQAAVMNWSVDTRYDSEPRPERTLISWSLLHTGLAQNDWQGRMKYAYTYPGLELAFARQTKLTVRAFADYVRLLEEEFDTVFLGSPQRRTVYSGYSAQVDATPSKAWSGSLAVSHSWNTFDYDFGAGPRYPRVSPAALTDPDAERDPGPAASAYYQGRLEWKPAEALRGSISYTRSRMVRNDTRRLAFDQGLYTLQATVQVSRSGFCRLRADFDSLQSRVHGQVLAGWTPSPGTAVYFGYDDDWRRDGFN